jgi:hypothetical protein
MALPESTLSERFAGRDDLEAIARFLPGLGGPRFSERYPGRTLIDFLDWKYFQNPLGDAVVGIATDGGQVVGLVAATPKTLWLDLEWAAVYELGDFLTDDRYRGRGIFSSLIERVCAELARRKAALAYVRPNENSFPILVRRGNFTEARQIDGSRFVFPSDVLARKLSPSAAVFGRMGLDWAALRWVLAPAPASIEVCRIDRFGTRHDRLWQAGSRGYRLAIDRRSAYLNWRYADSPTPFSLWDARRNGEAVGYLAAFVSPSSRTGHIADLFTASDDDDACAALLATCFRSLREQGVRSIYCWRPRGDEGSAVARALARACPVSNGQPLHFAVRILDSNFRGLPPSAWQLSMGDFDGV